MNDTIVNLVFFNHSLQDIFLNNFLTTGNSKQEDKGNEKANGQSKQVNFGFLNGGLVSFPPSLISHHKFKD